jgi:type II secretory pathway component PulJ
MMTGLEWLAAGVAVATLLGFGAKTLSLVLALQREHLALQARVSQIERAERFERLETMYTSLDRDIKHLGEQVERLTLVLVSLGSGKEFDLKTLLMD